MKKECCFKKTMRFVFCLLLAFIIMSRGEKECAILYAEEDRENKYNNIEVNRAYKLNDLDKCYVITHCNRLKFTVNQNGRIKVLVKDCTDNDFHNYYYHVWQLYQNDQRVHEFDWEQYTSETATGPWVTIQAGTYVLQQWADNTGGVHFGGSNPEANITVVFEPESAYVGEKEDNDTYDSANILLNGVTYEADRSHANDEDVYKLTMDNPGKVSINVSKHDYDFYSEDQNYNVTHLYDLNEGESELRLPAGNFYIVIDPRDNYSISAKIEYEDDSYEREFNNVSTQATKVECNNWYTGNFNGGAYETDLDFYQFSVDKLSDVSVQMKVPRQAPAQATIYLYNENLKQIVKANTSSNPFMELKTQILEEGTYFVKVEGVSKVGGDYSINVTMKTHRELSRTKFSGQMGKKVELELSDTDSDIVWKSSNKKIATVNNKGTVTIKGVGETQISAEVDGDVYYCKVIGKSDFDCTTCSDDYSSYKITKISQDKLYVTLKAGKEKYDKIFKLNSSGTSATASFKCKYGKTHKIVLSYSRKKGQLSGKENTKCVHSLW